VSRARPAENAYVRPMRGWWRRNPYFLRYMLREGSALFLTGYALTLLFGLFRLSQGAAAYEGWRAALATPWAIALHGLALVFVAYHSWTWFQVMPKTMPPLPLPARAVTAAGVAATLLLSLLLLAWLR
jgi:fumarate reductase subunit C